MPRVYVVGSLNIDSVVEVERHPQPGETLMGGDVATYFGGKGANQAVAAAAAGADVSFIGRVGDDSGGHDYVARLRARGIDASGVTVTPDSTTGHAMIAVDARAENTIIVSPGANARLGLADLTPLEGMQPGDVLLAPLESDLNVIAEAARMARARNARVVLNLAPFAELPAAVLALADPVVVNEHEVEQLERSGVSPQSLLVTLGSAGSRWGSIEVSAARVERVVDTTGAGDSYCGTLAAGLAAGLDARAAMQAASDAAGRAVAWVGAQQD
ncbi:PfkB family carbohydrate kinase [Agreia sp. VKM Ac-1783]|uniref:PfkB family carbohydrate kinase n=1 Tax=Agreia sp. VKM Ac-1783 TaxID=1938889 RepID=UPI000A2AEAB8|nr:PfkB family carbohydrate kinase [Agreia sp. VKM Ac-1783]SMQ60073.1 ribokinase [Agreia sp. VKM Ac-1783]